MAEKPIVLLGSPLLWAASTPVTDVTADDAQQAMRDLDDTLARFRTTTGWGRGISAVQIGAPIRLTYMRLLPDVWDGARGRSASSQREAALEEVALFNPEIVDRSDETFDLWDDCFSFPDLLVRVSRNYRVAVRFQDERGQMRELTAEGSLSELLQHELDHLDGILAIDRRIDDRSLCLREERDRRRLQGESARART